jgi:hypothetical protein
MRTLSSGRSVMSVVIPHLRPSCSYVPSSANPERMRARPAVTESAPRNVFASGGNMAPFSRNTGSGSAGGGATKEASFASVAAFRSAFARSGSAFCISARVGSRV